MAPPHSQQLRERIDGLTYRFRGEHAQQQLVELGAEAVTLLQELKKELLQPATNSQEVLAGLALLFESIAKVQVAQGRKYFVRDTKMFDESQELLRRQFNYEESST